MSALQQGWRWARLCLVLGALGQASVASAQGPVLLSPPERIEGTRLAQPPHPLSSQLGRGEEEDARETGFLRSWLPFSPRLRGGEKKPGLEIWVPVHGERVPVMPGADWKNMKQEKPAPTPAPKPMILPETEKPIPMLPAETRPLLLPLEQPELLPPAKPVAPPAEKPAPMPPVKPVALPVALPTPRPQEKPVAPPMKPITLPVEQSVPMPQTELIAPPVKKPEPMPKAGQPVVPLPPVRPMPQPRLSSPYGRSSTPLVPVIRSPYSSDLPRTPPPLPNLVSQPVAQPAQPRKKAKKSSVQFAQDYRPASSNGYRPVSTLRPMTPQSAVSTGIMIFDEQ